MRYAIVADIHANWQAWNAVLLDIRSDGVNEIICLGDIVGYGPNPAEVLESVHANVEHVVLGNHDAVIGDKMDGSLFTEDAREILNWTRERVNDDAIHFLRNLPLTIAGDSFRCAHGDFSDPAAFNYVMAPEDALPSWKAVDDPLLFVGHTHDPGIFILGASGTPRLVGPQEFVLEEEKRFLVSVGSVGQPRDGDARACYCIYDTDSQAILWRRIPFDLDAYRAAVEDAGIPDRPSYFLRHDPRVGTPPIRELLSFSPPTTTDMKARDVVEVQQMEVLQRRVIRWKILFSVILVLGLVLAATAGVWGWRYHTRGLDIADPAKAAVSAMAFSEERNLLSLPSSPIPKGSPIPGWSLHVGDKRSQGISADREADGTAFFLLASGMAGEEMRLASPRIEVTPGMKLCLEGHYRKSEDFSGSVSAVVSLIKAAGAGEERSDQYLVKEPVQIRKGSGLVTKQTFTVPANSRYVELQIRGRFTGNVKVSGLSLTRVK